jgi:hypothetical protein
VLRPEYTADFLARFWSKVEKTETCWLWIDRPRNGYGRISTTYRGPVFAAHQVAYELASGTLIDGRLACHTCDVKLCVRNDAPRFHEVGGVLIPTWGHLFAGTPLQNSRDMVIKGRSLTGARNPARLHPERLARGERHRSRLHPETYLRGAAHPSKTRPDYFLRGETSPFAKLTEDAVRSIRAVAETGMKPGKIAVIFGVGRSTIQRVLSGESWRHVT